MGSFNCLRFPSLGFCQGFWIKRGGFSTGAGLVNSWSSYAGFGISGFACEVFEVQTQASISVERCFTSLAMTYGEKDKGLERCRLDIFIHDNIDLPYQQINSYQIFKLRIQASSDGSGQACDRYNRAAKPSRTPIQLTDQENSTVTTGPPGASGEQQMDSRLRGNDKKINSPVTPTSATSSLQSSGSTGVPLAAGPQQNPNTLLAQFTGQGNGLTSTRGDPSAKKETVTPPALQGLAFIAGNDPTTGTLSWFARDNVTEYRIYLNGNPNPIAKPTASSYTFTGLVPGTTYTFTVTVVDKEGQESAQSEAKSVAIIGAPPQGKSFLNTLGSLFKRSPEKNNNKAASQASAKSSSGPTGNIKLPSNNKTTNNPTIAQDAQNNGIVLPMADLHAMMSFDDPLVANIPTNFISLSPAQIKIDLDILKNSKSPDNKVIIALIELGQSGNTEAIGYAAARLANILDFKEIDNLYNRYDKGSGNPSQIDNALNNVVAEIAKIIDRQRNKPNHVDPMVRQALPIIWA